MVAGSLKDDILSIENDQPSSTFNQQRSKIKVDAFSFLFHAFNDTMDYTQFTYKGYHLLAVDGDTAYISYDSNNMQIKRVPKVIKPFIMIFLLTCIMMLLFKEKQK